MRDREYTYQYRAFGIPDLALKRGMGRDLVVAPYAAALAAMIDPARSLQNLRLLESMGMLGEYGFYDAMDFTRPAPGARYAIVQTTFRTRGMTLVSLPTCCSLRVAAAFSATRGSSLSCCARAIPRR